MEQGRNKPELHERMEYLPDVYMYEKYFRIFLVIFYLVGFTGLLINETHDFFTGLFPLALLLSFTVMMLFHRPVFTVKSIIVFSAVAVSGFFIEVAGVSTHRIFGAYTYGLSLGPGFMDVPFLIGINWLMLSYVAYYASEKLNSGVLVKILTASLGMVLYDVILELVAPATGMWTWTGGSVPLRNYVAWFLISVIFQIFFRLAGIIIRNPLSVFIIIVQAVFFMAQYLLNKILI